MSPPPPPPTPPWYGLEDDTPPTAPPWFPGQSVWSERRRSPPPCGVVWFGLVWLVLLWVFPLFVQWFSSDRRPERRRSMAGASTARASMVDGGVPYHGGGYHPPSSARTIPCGG